MTTAATAKVATATTTVARAASAVMPVPPTRHTFFRARQRSLHARHTRARTAAAVASPAWHVQPDDVSTTAPAARPQRAHRTTTRADGVGWGGIRPARRARTRGAGACPPPVPCSRPRPNFRTPYQNATSMEAVRAFVYLATDGADGASPHPIADIVRALTLAKHRVALTHAAIPPAPLHLELTVDDVPIAIFASKDPADATGVYVVRGNQWVRAEARRTADVPVLRDADGAMLDLSGAFATDWRAAWPTSADLAAGETADARLAALGARLTGKEVDGGVLARCVVPYVSESAIADAVGLLLAHPRPKARKGGGGARAAPRLVETSAA